MSDPGNRLLYEYLFCRGQQPDGPLAVSLEERLQGVQADGVQGVPVPVQRDEAVHRLQHGGQLLVGLDALVGGMRDSVPAYRSQHLEANEKALRAGFERWPLEAPAWEEHAA